MKKEFISNSNRSLFNFLFKYFFKTKVGPIIALVFPIVFMVMYIIITAMKNAEVPEANRSSAYFVSGFPTYVVLSIIPLSFITLPQTMVEMKNSILLRKIKTSGFTKMHYLSFTYLQYFFFSWCSVFITLIIYFSLLNVNVNKDMDNVHWWGLFYAIFMLILSSNAFGILLGSLFKSAMATQLFGVCMLFIVMAFGGLFMPVSVIGDVLPIKIISMFLPTNYSINMIINSTFVSPNWFLEGMQKFQEIGNLINSGQAGASGIIAFKSNYEWGSPSNINSENLGYSLFDFKHSLYYVDSSYDFRFLNPNFGGIDKWKPGDEPLVVLTLKTVEIFPVWQKILNIVMAPICTILMLTTAWYRFSWYGR